MYEEKPPLPCEAIETAIVWLARSDCAETNRHLHRWKLETIQRIAIVRGAGFYESKSTPVEHRRRTTQRVESIEGCLRAVVPSETGYGRYV